MPELGAIAGGGLPSGKYIVRIDEIEASRSKQGDSPRLQFTAEVLVGTERGEKARWGRSLQKQAGWKLGRELLALGLSPKVKFPEWDDRSIAEKYVEMLNPELRGAVIEIAVEDPTDPKYPPDTTMIKRTSLDEPGEAPGRRVEAAAANV